MTVIEAGSEETWPDRMLKALSDCAENLAAYHAKRAKIDRAAERDVILRINRPVNPFQEVWDDVLRISQHAISRKRLLGFHATRLTDTERRDIGLNGLRVPSPELLARRLQAALSEGILSDVHLAALRSRNQVGDANRRDRMSFCFSRGLLQDEGGHEAAIQFVGR